MKIWRTKSAGRIASAVLGALCASPCRAAIHGVGSVAGKIGVPIEHFGEALPYFMTVGGVFGALFGAVVFVLATRRISWQQARLGMECMVIGQLLFMGGLVMMP